jgi:hypothetical protein
VLSLIYIKAWINLEDKISHVENLWQIQIEGSITSTNGTVKKSLLRRRATA